MTDTDHFKTLFDWDKEVSLLEAAPGAGWGCWQWKVHAATMAFSNEVAEGCFRIAARAATDYLRDECGTRTIAWVSAAHDKAAEFFVFRVGFLHDLKEGWVSNDKGLHL